MILEHHLLYLTVPCLGRRYILTGHLAFMSPVPITLRNFLLAIDARPVEVKGGGRLGERGAFNCRRNSRGNCLAAWREFAIRSFDAGKKTENNALLLPMRHHACGRVMCTTRSYCCGTKQKKIYFSSGLCTSSNRQSGVVPNILPGIKHVD